MVEVGVSEDFFDLSFLVFLKFFGAPVLGFLVLVVGSGCFWLGKF